MARTIAEIQAEIITAKNNDATLAGLTSTSAYAIWRLWTYVVATAIWTLENLYDLHKADVLEEVAKLKPHTLRWYQQKALDFQYGDNLVEGQDYYDNTGVDPDDIEAAQIIAAAAAVEEGSTLVIKVNKEVSGELEPLSSTEYDAFSEYMSEIKDAGVALEVLSTNADQMKIEVDCYYDPLILGPDGARLDGTETEPVQDAAKAFLRALPYNGLFVKAHLTDALQAVDGVFVPEVRAALAAGFGNPSFTSIDIEYQPISGFLRFYDDETDLVINFIEHV